MAAATDDRGAVRHGFMMDVKLESPLPGWALGIPLGLMLGPILAYGLFSKKDKKMTALENALLNLVAPLIDTLRGVEKERDDLRDKNRKLIDESFKHGTETAKLEDQVRRLTAEVNKTNTAYEELREAAVAKNLHKAGRRRGSRAQA
jgi:hypothetical protein